MPAGEFFFVGGKTHTIRIFRMTVILTMAPVSSIISFPKQKAAQPAMPVFSELSHEDSARLDRQRAIIAAAAKQRYGTSTMKKTVADLPVLQRLIDDKVFSKSQTYELQSLGVAFGVSWRANCRYVG